MSRRRFTVDRSHGLLLSSLLWPTGIIFACALWVVFSTILWTTENINEQSVQREEAQLAAALEQHMSGMRARLAAFVLQQDWPADTAAWSADAAALARFDAQAKALNDFSAVLLIRPDWTPLAGRYNKGPGAEAPIEKLRALMDGATAAATARAGRPEGRLTRSHASGDAITSALVIDGDDIYTTYAYATGPTSVSRQQGGSAPLIIASRRLPLAALRRIASVHDLDEVQITRDAPVKGAASLALKDAAGRTAAHLTWSASRPGDVMRGRLVPLTLVGFCVAAILFGLVAGYLHWLARDLVATEARSRAILGRDPLSGLANRLMFSERLDLELERLPRVGGGVAVHFIDLDRFKDVNDTFGHQAGDDLIRLVAQRLTNLVRSTDVIARFGGDEFAIIQTALRANEDAGALGKRILEALTQPFALSHSQVLVGASIGIALAPDHGTTREVLMGLADTALYKAKSEGRNRYVFFQARMDETIRMRKLVEEELRRAIDEDQLVLHYQPLFSSDGTKVVAVEALVRWPHPVRGMIPPGDFIPVAEERGLVIPLGEWVLRRACEDGKRWPGIRVAVNVSPIQFRHRDFVPKVVAMLEQTGFDPSRLELELTEGVVVEDADAAESAMMDLRALGIHLALDDFGTGYSSLIYLRRFAFDTIKIDRSFLESMEATGESAILVHSMVHLGRALGLTVTAEGVETREQHRFLQALGCHQLQGYLFSKPVAVEQIDEMVAAGRIDDQADAA